MSAPSRPFHKKLAALLLGATAALVLSELTMRAAGWISYSLSGRGDATGLADYTILCHGDSNVFGLWEAPEESYPGQLEKLLNERSTGKRFKVVNLGVPGMVSGHLLSVIESEVERIEPDLVLATVGANDAWSWKPSSGIAYIEPPFWESFRLVKAVRVFISRREEAAQGANLRPELHADVELQEQNGKLGKVYSFTNREGEAMLRYSGEEIVMNPTQELLTSNLKNSLGRLSELVGDRLLFVGYGSDERIYGKANPILKQVAEERGIKFVESAPLLVELSERLSFNEVYYTDFHPRGVGYEVIARRVYSRLVELGFVEGTVIEDPLADLSRHDRFIPPVRLVGTVAGNDLAIVIKGEEAGRDFMLLLWDVHKGGDDPPIRPHEEIMKTDPILRWSLKSKSMRGTFDEEGNARVSLQPLMEKGMALDEIPGTRFRAGYTVKISKTDQRISRFSSGVVLEFQ